MKFYPIKPIPKPRMTRADKWRKRPATQRYWDFVGEIQRSGMKIPDRVSLIFHIKMPISWNETKKSNMAGKPHQTFGRNDLDNLVKSILDAVHKDDGHVWEIHAQKVWARESAIGVEPLGPVEAFHVERSRSS